jgi:hypothetical protein
VERTRFSETETERLALRFLLIVTPPPKFAMRSACPNWSANVNHICGSSDNCVRPFIRYVSDILLES